MRPNQADTSPLTPLEQSMLKSTLDHARPGDLRAYGVDDPSTLMRTRLPTHVQRLAAAIMFVSVKDLDGKLRTGCEGRGKARLYQRNAQDWFASNDTTYLFSFISCCEILGINPRFFRRLLADLGSTTIQTHNNHVG